MTAQLFPQSFLSRSASLEERIQGTPAGRIAAEFFATSALFPILDAIRVVSVEGWINYLSEFSHYILFGAVFTQAWFLGTAKTDNWVTRFLGNLLGFLLYVAIDVSIEGLEFFSQPYHWLFGIFSLAMATFSALQWLVRENTVGRTGATLLLNITKVSLLPAMYFISEINLEVSAQLTLADWQEYMQNSGHQFLFYGTLFLGLLLGLAEAQRNTYARVLRFIARQLKKYSEWSLSADLVADAIEDPNALQLQRVTKTMLFMDIRGFTAWTERTDPQHAVDMLNRYYNMAESIIKQHHGHKPNFTADEVMTRFPSPQAALDTALKLQQELAPLLAESNLAVGIGLHTGEIIEGLMGSDTTRKYDIIGDAVNTAKRLESAAGRGEIVVSEITYRALDRPVSSAETRALQVKGKSDLLQVFAIKTQP